MTEGLPRRDVAAYWIGLRSGWSLRALVVVPSTSGKYRANFVCVETWPLSYPF